MSPKKVLGIILIVLGVLSVINASGTLVLVDFFGDEIHAMNATMEKHGNIEALNILDTTDSERIITQSKVLSVMALLAGAIMGIIGFLMFRNAMPQPVYEFDDDEEQEILDEPSFKF